MQIPIKLKRMEKYLKASKGNFLSIAAINQTANPFPLPTSLTN